MAALFYDDEFDALTQTISNSRRGFKEAAAFLFPHLKPESAYARLKACLNSERDERLTVGQVIALCRFCESYDVLMFMADELSHARPVPITRDDERARLQREFVESTRVQQHILERLERLAEVPGMASVRAVK